jgi:hypothetical protein
MTWFDDERSSQLLLFVLQLLMQRVWPCRQQAGQHCCSQLLTVALDNQELLLGAGCAAADLFEASSIYCLLCCMRSSMLASATS